METISAQAAPQKCQASTDAKIYKRSEEMAKGKAGNIKEELAMPNASLRACCCENDGIMKNMRILYSLGPSQTLCQGLVADAVKSSMQYCFET